MVLKKAAIAVAITAAFGASQAMAAQVSSGYTFTGAGAGSNFTMLTADGTGGVSPVYGDNGGTFGGTNNVTFTWDGTVFNANSDYTGPGGTSNATLSSPTKFAGANWVAHDVQVFAPGTYTFDTALGGGNTEAGTMTMTVGAGQFGVHMLFDWGGNTNIDVVNVWNMNQTFSNCGSAVADPAAVNCLYTGAANPTGNTASTVWLFASTDPDGDGTLGVPMAAGGPFQNFNANFNTKGTLTAVPVPAAVWLLGSGLLGLVGVARRKKTLA